jgi:hypothetical protein
MSGVFQNIDPPPPASVYPPAFVAGGGHTRWVERGWGGQYFGRRQTLLCTLHTVPVCIYFVREPHVQSQWISYPEVSCDMDHLAVGLQLELVASRLPAQPNNHHHLPATHTHLYFLSCYVDHLAVRLQLELVASRLPSQPHNHHHLPATHTLVLP